MGIIFILDKSTGTLLYQQLAEQIKIAIARGQLSEGTRLPPVRRMAAELGVSTTTVAQAYDLLSRERIVGSYVGRGTYILPSPLTALARGRLCEPMTPPVKAWPSLCSDAPEEPASLFPLPTSRSLQMQQLLQDASQRWGDPATLIPLSSGQPDVELFPVERWAESMARAGRALAAERAQPEGLRRLQYGSLLGDETVRGYLSDYCTRVGFHPEPCEIMLTSGNQQALDLVARTLLEPGDTVLVEEPTYLAALDIFESRGVLCLPVPVDQDGLRCDLLEQRIREALLPPRLLYTVPTGQSPSGAIMSLERRQQLIELAARYHFFIVEDDYCSELCYEEPWKDQAPPALRSFDRQGQVLYLKSFNKVLFPTLRLGYIVAAPALLARLTAGQQLLSREISLPLARALLEHLSDRAFEDELAAQRATYRRRRDALLQALAAELTGLDCSWSVPGAGFNLWLQLPPALLERELFAKAAERGLLLAPGQYFLAHDYPPRPPGVRLTFADQTPEQLWEGARRLSSALRALRQNGRHDQAPPGLFTSV